MNNECIINIVKKPISPYSVEKEEDYSIKYQNRYINLLSDVSIPKHKKFEYLSAIELTHISWDDLPPDFEEHFDLPHRMDYGVDTINLQYTQTGQAKCYGSNSTIKWSDICNFRTYSKDLLDIAFYSHLV